MILNIFTLKRYQPSEQNKEDKCELQHAAHGNISFLQDYIIWWKKFVYFLPQNQQTCFVLGTETPIAGTVPEA